MKHITGIRKAVCTIANNLHRSGYTLADAFRKAWSQIRKTTVKAVGVTADNRQSRLEYLSGFRKDDLQIGFRREADNKYDSNAIQILVMIKSLRKYTVIGYIPKETAAIMAAVMDKGIKVKATLKGIIGGEKGYKDNYGMLVNMAV